ncbi:hypothetical protein C8Q77DRAFT_1074260 [Trametes polyzona]|nr:hypothetical protein C8Q77DRAFT_1074260 [Trametes polyzona]
MPLVWKLPVQATFTMANDLRRSTSTCGSVAAGGTRLDRSANRSYKRSAVGGSPRILSRHEPPAGTYHRFRRDDKSGSSAHYMGTRRHIHARLRVGGAAGDEQRLVLALRSHRAFTAPSTHFHPDTVGDGGIGPQSSGTTPWNMDIIRRVLSSACRSDASEHVPPVVP